MKDIIKTTIQIIIIALALAVIVAFTFVFITAVYSIFKFLIYVCLCF
ncbi:MAG: hypothetical protein RR557_06135 [Bacilli bacterium]